jgi:hypothetical protein
VVPLGIFVEQNDHYVLRKVSRQPSSRSELFNLENARGLEIEPSPENLGLALEIISKKWEESISRGNEIARVLWRAKG